MKTSKITNPAAFKPPHAWSVLRGTANTWGAWRSETPWITVGLVNTDARGKAQPVNTNETVGLQAYCSETVQSP